MNVYWVDIPPASIALLENMMSAYLACTIREDINQTQVVIYMNNISKNITVPYAKTDIILSDLNPLNGILEPLLPM